MLENQIISKEELSGYGSADTLNEQAVALVQQQKVTWEMAGKNYKALSAVQTKEFDFGHFQTHVHHNPGRLRSSAAKTDPHIIAQRPCFLCSHNLQPEQKGILYHEDYLILANPFPIFPVHLTISLLKHLPQRIENYFTDMLDLSKNLTGFTVFYNGPECGASAPDHFHFQAGLRGIMLVEKEFKVLTKEHAKAYFKKKNVEIYAVENYLRRFLAIVSPHKNEVAEIFEYLYSSLLQKGEDEPMMNVLSWFEKGKWHIIIFPRDKQRPYHFFESGRNQIIVGPAAVEMGGILILPRHEDFIITTHKLIADIYEEVTIKANDFNHWISVLEQYS